MSTVRGNSTEKAFTLLEITLAVTILALMSFAIYRFVQANVVAMRVSASAETADAQYDGLRALLAQQLPELPPGTGALLGDALKVNDRDRDEVTWICSAGPGVMTRYAAGDYRATLRLRPHAESSNSFELGILRKPKEDVALSHVHESWVRLIDNVTSLQIRYFDPRLNTWVQRWADTVTLPRLVKLVIGRNDTPVPTEIVVPLARTAL